ncbi:hypothetical protein K438DRAFT_2044496 [Mycena galopus ATCC 62051]|nr:hypothetical protein K438DRAFT_2044496 [Mycena galopus ATCC 62051]
MAEAYPENRSNHFALTLLGGAKRSFGIFDGRELSIPRDSFWVDLSVYGKRQEAERWPHTAKNASGFSTEIGQYFRRIGPTGQFIARNPTYRLVMVALTVKLPLRHHISGSHLVTTSQTTRLRGFADLSFNSTQIVGASPSSRSGPRVQIPNPFNWPVPSPPSVQQEWRATTASIRTTMSSAIPYSHHAPFIVSSIHDIFLEYLEHLLPPAIIATMPTKSTARVPACFMDDIDTTSAGALLSIIFITVHGFLVVQDRFQPIAQPGLCHLHASWSGFQLGAHYPPSDGGAEIMIAVFSCDLSKNAVAVVRLGSAQLVAQYLIS